MNSSIIDSILARPELLHGAYPPASQEEIAQTQQALGFRLPDLLTELLTRVGNGGFGPLPGGFLGGPAGYHPDGNLVSCYELIRSAPDTYPWPDRVLPFFDWGGACRCYLDCSLENSPVIFCDPRSDKAYYAKDDANCERDPIFVDSVSGMVIEAPDLETWLAQWLDGTLTMGQGKSPWKPANWNIKIPDGPVIYFVREQQPEFDF